MLPNMMQELHIASLLFKGASRRADVVTPDEAIRMATINGAKAMGIDHLCGSLEVGKCADLIVISADAPHMTPITDPRAAVVYAAQGSDIRCVLVDGVFLMKERKLCGYDLAELKAEAQASSDRIQHFGSPL